ncbi:MAG: hypothetical protein U0164_20750 [Gemmatimonadaceae bacterium]
MDDTRPEAAALLRAIIARQSPAERLAAGMRMSEEVRAIALASMRKRHPDEPLLTLIERLTGEPMRPMVRSGPYLAP